MVIYRKGRFTIEKNNNAPRRTNKPKNTSKVQQKGRFKIESVEQPNTRFKMERVDHVSMNKTLKLICELKQLLSKFPNKC